MINYQLIDEIFDLQVKNKFNVSISSVKTRINYLKKLKSSILSHRNEIEEAIYLDFKKSKIEVSSTEIYPVITEIKNCCKNLKHWVKPRRVKNNLIFFGAQSQIKYEARGNCLIISPWNYPFQMNILYLITCIAAGNTAIIKPSEFTINTNKVLKKIISEVFDRDYVALIEGDAEITTYLLSKDFQHIHFTGSPTVGKIVMEAAAKKLASVTLELGGKSPLIVDDTISIVKVVSRVIWGKLVNYGQTCIAPDYLLIHEDRLDEFIIEFKKQMLLKFGDNPVNSPDLARIINIKNYKRIKNLISNALEHGAVCDYGNEYIEEDLYIKPTILRNIPVEADILKEEIFGPVLPIITYNNLDEAINYVNSGEKPLALYIFSENNKTIKKIIKETSSGAVLINDTLIHFMHPNLPFGGVNNSGLGVATGYYGFKEFSHAKPVIKVNKFFNSTGLLNYPYASKTQNLINLLIKYL